MENNMVTKDNVVTENNMFLSTPMPYIVEEKKTNTEKKLDIRYKTKEEKIKIENRNKHYIGYDASTLGKLSYNLKDTVETIYPNVKNIKIEDMMTVRPFTTSLVGQEFTTEYKVSNDKKKLNLQGIKENDEYIYTNIGDYINGDNLRGFTSGYSDSTYLNLDHFED